MQNRFGLKDVFVVVLLLATLASVWLSMVQKTRIELAVDGLRVKLGEMERQAALFQREVEKGFAEGVVVQQGAGGIAVSNDAWARPGVAIQRWPNPAPATDPEGQPGFSVGGEFTEIFEAQPAKLVPYIQSDVYGTRVLDRVCEGLGSFDPKTLKMVGVLADAWQIDPDGLWIRAHINPRARFSDGAPVTAEDVRWTNLDFVGNPLIEAERTRSTQDNLKDVKVIDERTVEFLFKEPFFTNVLIAFGNPVLPKHWYSKFEPSQLNQATGLLMGSGQFKLERLPTGPEDLGVQWTPGTDVVLVRNEQYWAAKPSLERIRYKTVSDELARLVAFRNGEGDLITPSSPQFNKVTREEPGFEEKAFALKWVNMRCGYSFIAWQCGPRAGKDLTPFADVRVRRAMTHLLDRERMITDIWDGIGIVSKGPMNPESPASDPATKPYAYDPEKGKALLAEAGWQDRNGDGILEDASGKKFTFEYTYASGGEIAERLARFVKDSYAKAGIDVVTRPVEWSRYQEILKLRDFDAITLAWGANAPESDPRQIYHSESMKEGGDNFVQWKNADADALIEKGRRTMDESERMLVWRQLEQVIAADQPYTFVRVSPWLRFVSREYGNVNTYRTGLQPEEFYRVALPAPGSE